MLLSMFHTYILALEAFNPQVYGGRRWNPHRLFINSIYSAQIWKRRRREPMCNMCWPESYRTKRRSCWIGSSWERNQVDPITISLSLPNILMAPKECRAAPYPQIGNCTSGGGSATFPGPCGYCQAHYKDADLFGWVLRSISHPPKIQSGWILTHLFSIDLNLAVDSLFWTIASHIVYMEFPSYHRNILRDKSYWILGIRCRVQDEQSPNFAVTLTALFSL